MPIVIVVLDITSLDIVLAAGADASPYLDQREKTQGMRKIVKLSGPNPGRR
jgi:hypothetical protein